MGLEPKDPETGDPDRRARASEICLGKRLQTRERPIVIVISIPSGSAACLRLERFWIKWYNRKYHAHCSPARAERKQETAIENRFMRGKCPINLFRAESCRLIFAVCCLKQVWVCPALVVWPVGEVSLTKIVGSFDSVFDCLFDPFVWGVRKGLFQKQTCGP